MLKVVGDQSAKLYARQDLAGRRFRALRTTETGHGVRVVAVVVAASFEAARANLRP